MSCSEDVDLVSAILDGVRRIPEGRVSTFGDLARAMGDVRAARAIGAVMASYHCEENLPVHRLLFSDGRVAGNETDPEGRGRFERLLNDEGIGTRDGLVLDFERLRFVDFGLPEVLKELQRQQDAMRSEVAEFDDFPGLRYIAGLDVSYSSDMACAAMVRMDMETLETVEERVALGKTRFPYIPGYLGYREVPMARKVAVPCDSTIFLVDGQGVLHPRGFGVACQVGVCLRIPTIGAAKSLLIGDVGPGDTRADILLQGRLRGRRIKPKGRRAIFVSVGHRVSLDTACTVCEALMREGVPEPLRLAHNLATRERKRMELSK